MIYIDKQTEPGLLTQYRNTPNASYKTLPKETKEEIKQQLLKEQKFLCAYCMQRIKVDTMKIEHYKSQSSNPAESLDYQNMLGVCKGNEGCPKDKQTCDTHKADTPITISPLIPGHMSQIKYTSAGYISSRVHKHQQDIDYILNLNSDQLKTNRKTALDVLKDFIKKKYKEKKITKSQLINLYQSYSNQTEYREYVGILLWYICKKISQAK